MKKWNFVLIALIIAVIMSACATPGGSSKEAELPPPPPGTERLTLGNAAQAIYRFDLPPGQTWGNYNKITAEYLVDEANIGRPLRSGSMRVYGNYRTEEELFIEGVDYVFDEAADDIVPVVALHYITLAFDENFAHRIIYNASETWESLGAVPNEWFTYEYDISGDRSHGQFNRINIPARNATGIFYFALGITGQDDARLTAITQLIRNVTLHHVSNPALNVVSTGSGFDLPAFASYGPVTARRVSGGPAQ
ncbi:MAG: hypothetical protein FWD40_00960 [Treponema sp.]|nr:hypothetical protein [Treponema sp.]